MIGHDPSAILLRADMKAVITDADRIFKLSGRYQVTDKFDITKFHNATTKDKYVFNVIPYTVLPSGFMC